ncbi:hypothetical protein FH608_031285 [Nonomuraea phyllanthi]|uniref:Uncharacterized protein n=2 Tax=Nonomuraea phyllanthi TaxID=2219224 RepID=A0A5C4VKN6_9ACTN|nr:hypothetical protein FH608_031285 [Nonomuraea phyllanthi]
MISIVTRLRLATTGALFATLALPGDPARAISLSPLPCPEAETCARQPWKPLRSRSTGRQPLAQRATTGHRPLAPRAITGLKSQDQEATIGHQPLHHHRVTAGRKTLDLRASLDGEAMDLERGVGGRPLEEGVKIVDQGIDAGTRTLRRQGRKRTRGEIAAAAALAQLGVPFSWGGGTSTGPTLGIGRGARTRGFDCSGLTLYAWARAGVKLGHYTGTQFRQGRRIPLSARRTGDLIFFGGGTGDPTHVALYLGGGLMIHAPKTGDVVKKTAFLTSPYYRAAYRGMTRPG